MSDVFNAFDSDDWLRELFAKNPIEWAPANLDDLVERRVFNMRHDDIRKSREFSILQNIPFTEPRELLTSEWSEEDVEAAKAWPELE
jgi:hypothetical protein